MLIAQASNDFMGGYVKYLTDLPATNGYVTTVVFPIDEPMTLIGQGPLGMELDLPAEGDGVRRGVGRVLTTPSYTSAHYTAAHDGELAADGPAAIRRRAPSACSAPRRSRTRSSTRCGAERCAAPASSTPPTSSTPSRR